jgi:predicted membrane channel-forming protein YqfA (hemolysin III family)
MSKKIKIAIVALTVIQFLLVIVGAFFKIMHLQMAEVFLIAGIVLWCACIILSVYTMFKKDNITGIQKTLWMLCFFFSGIFGIILYLLVFEKQETLEEKLNILQQEQDLTI